MPSTLEIDEMFPRLLAKLNQPNRSVRKAYPNVMTMTIDESFDHSDADYSNSRSPEFS